MVFLTEERRGARPLARFLPTGVAPNWADAVALVLMATAIVLIAHGATQMVRPIADLNTSAAIRLDPARLPEYALRTTLRMFAALGASLLFTFVVATAAAKSRKAEMLIVPALDVLQSVPVLGFLTFTVTFFLGLFPGSQLGAECASIFAIFTAQAWNMAFSFYQSLKTIPGDLNEVSRGFNLSAWRRFVRLELPFATPALVWNMMMSMSGAWFFVVASEAITVGNTTITLPGIGSWIALAVEHKDLKAVAWAVGVMGVVILLYDQLVFRPIVAWADKFRFEQTASENQPRSWIYDLVRRTRIIRQIVAPLSWPARLLKLIDARPPAIRLKLPPAAPVWIDRAWAVLVAALVIAGVTFIARFISTRFGVGDIVHVFFVGGLTLARVLVLIILASLIWVPIGVWIGLNPAWAERLQPVAQFLAAFPANVLFPGAVMLIVAWNLDPNIWLSPLMVLGTQWYILFNVIAGAAALPTDMKEAAGLFGLRGWQWWRSFVLPAIFPYYVTGAITASGGSWNAAIVAEYVSWGKTHVEALGLGSYIADATAAGDFSRVALGVVVMSLFVIAFNRTLWRPMFRFAERRLRID